MAHQLLDAAARMSLTSHSRRTLRSARSLRARTLRARTLRAGFTLIELMIVVAIVGILAVIAVVGYRKLVLSAKLTEARNMIGGVRIAQEAYKVERGNYASLGTGLCPLGTSGTTQTKTAWNPGCGAAPTWAVLPVHVDGPVQFGYTTIAQTTVAGAPPGTVGEPVAFVTIPAGVGTAPWYYVTASADLDGQGGLFTELVGTSWQNSIFVKNEGE